MPNTVNNSTRWDPKRIHRKVRLDEILDDGIVTWKSYSMTRPGRDVVHHPAIDFRTGAVTCTCEQHRYRLARHNPTIHTPQWHCKHVAAALANLRRKAQ